MRRTLLTAIALLVVTFSFAQNNVGIGTTNPKANALLDLESSDKGLLIPRVTTAQRLAINTNPALDYHGMLVFDTDLDQFHYWDGNASAWVGFPLDNDPNNENQNLSINANTLTISNGNSVVLPVNTGPAGLNCWDLNGNGTADLATEDQNNDGVVDALDCVGADGAVGPMGPAGANGAQGPQGIAGNDGIDCWDLNGNGTGDLATEDRNGDGTVDVNDCIGADGAVGPIGPAGAAGAQGPVGATGAQGPVGPIGAQGTQGNAGSDGVHCWDLNGNGTGDLASEDANGDGTVDQLDCQGDDGPQGTAGSDGIDCWDTNGNGFNDPGEDMNNDGFHNALDCIGTPGGQGPPGLPCWDSNGNGLAEPAEDVNNDGFWNSLDCLPPNAYNTAFVFTPGSGDLDITDGGGTQTINLNGLKDEDWLTAPGGGNPTSINDDIYTNGNVGIGTTNPISDLHVNGVTSANQKNLLGSDGNYFKLFHAGTTVPSPNQHVHYFADYNRQVGATDVMLFQGYNSDVLRYRWHSKWSGSNTLLMELDGTNGNLMVAGDIRPNNLPGTVGQVLMSQGPNAAPIWSNPPPSGISTINANDGLIGGGSTATVDLDVQADNGLNVDAVADAVQLGGPLVEDTDIDLATYDMTFDMTSTGEFKVDVANATKLLVSDNGGVSINQGNVPPMNGFRLGAGDFYNQDIQSNSLTTQPDTDLGYSCPTLTTSTAATWSGSQPIADNATTIFTVNIPSTAPICELEVMIRLTHTWDSDLDIFLESPSGTMVELTSDNGGSGDNYLNTRFDDDALTAITAGFAPFTGTFRPEGQLSDFDGEIPFGTWRLHVTDDFAADVGTFQFLQIYIASGVPNPASWDYVGEAAITYVDGSSIVALANYSADPVEDGGCEIRLTRDVTPGAGSTGTVLGYAADSPASGAANNWISTSINARETALTNGTTYYYKLWRNGDIENNNEHNWSIIPMLLKE